MPSPERPESIPAARPDAERVEQQELIEFGRGRERIGRDEAHDEANMMQARLDPKRQEAFSAAASSNMGNVNMPDLFQDPYKAAELTVADYERAFSEIQDLKQRAEKDPGFAQALALTLRVALIKGIKGLRFVDQHLFLGQLMSDKLGDAQEAVLNVLESAQESVKHLQDAGAGLAQHQEFMYRFDAAALNDAADGGNREEKLEKNFQNAGGGRVVKIAAMRVE